MADKDASAKVQLPVISGDEPPLVRFRPWSPSKADLANTCALAFKYKYVDKIKVEGKGTAAKVGTAVHRVQELVLKNEPINQAVAAALEEFKDELTTSEAEKVRSFTPNIEAFRARVDRLAQKHPIKGIYAEKSWAVSLNFEPCEYFDPTALIRGVVDLAILLENGQLLVIDHKSGRPWGVSKYMTQLDVYAILGRAHIPGLTAVQCGIHFLANADLKWAEVRQSKYIVDVLQPWLVNLLNTRTTRLEGYPATVSKHCSWCDYRDICPEKTAEKESNAAESETEAAVTGRK